MANVEKFKLEVGAMPKAQRRGFYDLVIQSFVTDVLENSAVTTKSARLGGVKKNPKSMQVGLSKAAQVAGRKDIKVSVINDEVWLAKK